MEARKGLSRPVGGVGFRRPGLHFARILSAGKMNTATDRRVAVYPNSHVARS